MSSRKLAIVITSWVFLTALAVPLVETALSDDATSTPPGADKVAPANNLAPLSPKRIVDTNATIESLKSSDRRTRLRAASDVAKLGGDAKKAVPALITMLQDDDVSLQEAAATALGTIGPNAKDALAPLIEALDRDPEVRSAAIVAIAEIGAEAKPAAPALRGLLKKTDDRVVLQAAVALHALAEEDQACRIALTQLLESKEPRVRQGAARELGTYRQLATDSIPALLSVLKDHSARGYVREAAVQALGEISPADPEVKEALVAALKDNRRSVQEAAEAALKKIR